MSDLADEDSWPAILSPGRNCWTDSAGLASAGLYIDARSYYRAFHRAARQARRYLLLAGWRFSSEVPLLRGRDAEGAGEVRLVPFLKGLLKANPELRIYVLAWDFSFNYALEWDWFQEATFEDGTRKRLEFLFDPNHAVGGSHHEKSVVVDGKVAFVGGLDLCDGDWDDRRHCARHPERLNLKGEPTHPYHDIQACLVGPAAREVARHFQERWRRAGGGELELPAEPQETPDLPKPSINLPAHRVALSLNRPCTLGYPDSALQIRQLYLDAIAAAEELIYLENQYFSSQAVYQALLDRMRAPGRPRLDIAIVLPKEVSSWVEVVAMGAPRLTMIEGLQEAARETGHRLGFYYTVADPPNGGPEVPVLIHSKLLLVDDRFLTVGSCNASNRSMGLDSELNVAWEARSRKEKELIRSIRRVRCSLLAEHCGLPRKPAYLRAFRRRQRLVPRLDRLADMGRGRLRRLTPEVVLNGNAWLESLRRLGLCFDPERPVIEETVYEALAPDSALGRGLVWIRQCLGLTTAAAR